MANIGCDRVDRRILQLVLEALVATVVVDHFPRDANGTVRLSLDLGRSGWTWASCVCWAKLSSVLEHLVERRVGLLGPGLPV